MKTFIFALLFIAGLVATPFPVFSADYQHKADLDKISIEWTIDGNFLNLRLEAKTASWVGIGFNPSKGMKDANFILGYVKGGKVKVTDDFGTTQRQHKQDIKIGGENNITNISGKEENKTTEISFTLPLNSEDEKDSQIFPDKDNIVLLAFGPGRDSFKSRHKFKAKIKVNFSTGKFSKIK